MFPEHLPCALYLGSAGIVSGGTGERIIQEISKI
jgi:hypothetical protein